MYGRRKGSFPIHIQKVVGARRILFGEEGRLGIPNSTAFPGAVDILYWLTP